MSAQMVRMVCVLVSLLAARESAACSCAPPPPPKQALEAATAVFTGKVVAIKQGDQPFAPKQVTFQVDRSFKGVGDGQVLVTTAANGAMCGYGFQQGKSYLVYCYGDKKSLSTNLCTRTRGLENAGEDLKELGVGKKPD